MRVVFIKKIYIAAVVAASKREFTLVINEHCAVVSRNAVLIAVASRALAAVASTPAIAAGSKTFCSI